MYVTLLPSHRAGEVLRGTTTTHLQHGTNRMVLDELLCIQPAQLADDIRHMVCSTASTNNSRSKVDDLLYAVSLGSIARSVNGYTIS